MFYSIIHHFQSRKQLYKYKTFWMFSFLPSGVTSRKWDGRGEREVKWETEMVSGLVKCKILDFIWCFPRSLKSLACETEMESLRPPWVIIGRWLKLGESTDYSLVLTGARSWEAAGQQSCKLHSRGWAEYQCLIREHRPRASHDVVWQVEIFPENKVQK